jgi:integrase
MASERAVERGIYERTYSDGAVKYAIRVQEGGKQRRIEFGSIEEAREQRQRRLAVPSERRQAMLPNIPIDETLMLAVLEHLRRRQPALAESTINGYRKTAHYHAEPWARRHRWTAAGVNFQDFEAFCAARQTGGNSAYTNAVKWCLVLGRSLVELGFRNDNPAVNPDDPAKRLDAKPRRRSTQTVKTRARRRAQHGTTVWLPEWDEVESIISAVPGRLHQLWFWVLALTALRPSEAAGLQWDRDIILRRHVIIPHEPLVEVNGRRILLGVDVNSAGAAEAIEAKREALAGDGDLKAGKSHLRDVSILRQLDPVLAELEDQFRTDTPWVFPGRETAKATDSAIGSFPLSYEHTENSLRHLFGSTLRRHGFTYAQISMQMGNSERVCEQTYQHALPGDATEVRERITSLGAAEAPRRDSA